jgi:hypothetical protein
MCCAVVQIDSTFLSVVHKLRVVVKSDDVLCGKTIKLSACFLPLFQVRVLLDVGHATIKASNHVVQSLMRITQ